MEVTFVGTRGEIKVRSRRHRRHTALLIQRGSARIMVDCGADWRDRLQLLSPTAIVLTHAHPDHAGGLVAGAPCPVYATDATWQCIAHHPTLTRRVIPIKRTVHICGINFRATPVEHSIRAPAVGYRISIGNMALFYVPDVADIPHSGQVLSGIDIFIGDGATVRRSLVRQRDGRLIGHAPIMTQLGWCKKASVRQAIFTHCGSQIVRAESTQAEALIRQLGREFDIDARIAYDGMKLRLAKDA